MAQRVRHQTAPGAMMRDGPGGGRIRRHGYEDIETMLRIDGLTIRPIGICRIVVGMSLLATPVLVAGCAETIIGAGATTAVAASQERGLGGAVGDTQIRTAINFLWFEQNSEMYHQLNLNVHEGRVMITGVVAKQEWKDEAIRRAWRAKGVKEVIDEIVVDPKGTSGTYARDAWIATQFKTKLLLDKNIYSINYSTETVRGKVYVLGIAQDRTELDLVLNNARSIDHVRQVVSYVLLKDDPRRTGAPPGSVTTGSTTGTGPAPADASYYPTARPASGDGVESYGGTGGSIGTATPRNGGGSIQAVPLEPLPSGS